MKRLLVTAGLLPCLLVSVAHAAHQHHNHMDMDEEGLTIGGFLNAEGAYADQDIGGDRELRFLNDTEIHFMYSRTAGNGLRYGGVIELEADVSPDFKEEGVNADKTYVWLNSAYGRVELGAVDDAGHRLQVDASTIARGTGGIHGDWFYHVAFPSAPGAGHHGGHNSFLHFPALPLHHMHGAAEDATKISYYSPEWAGLRFGLSYLPESDVSGTASSFNGKAGHRAFNDVLNAGVSYDTRIGNVGMKASLTGERGRAEVSGHEDLGAYVAGLEFDWRGFSIAGSYGDWNKSVSHMVANNPDAYYATLGISYAHGPFGVSLTGFKSDYQFNEAHIVSLSTDYAVAPGLTPYAEVTWVDLDAADPTLTDNEATVFITGVQINF